MRLLLACIVLVGLAASVSAQRAAAPLTYKSCTASGDPHFVTFDGCLHDFQAVDGVYNFASHLSPLTGASFDVQSRITTCGTAIIAGLRVSCIRHTTWRAALAGLGETVCRWGYWNGVYENVACTHKNNVSGTTDSLSLPIGQWIPTSNPKWRQIGFYNFTRSTSGFLTATPLNDFVGNFPIVSTAAHAIEIKSPSTVDNQVAGLCGVPNGIPADDYSYYSDAARSLTNVVPSATKSRIYNTFAIMNAWGLGNAVQPDGSGVIKPFGYAHLHEQGHVFEAADVPAPVLPTSDEQKAVQALTVTDLGKLADIEKACAAQFGDNRAGFDSCVYDMSSVTDPVVIASNAAVVAQASTTTDSGSSSSTTLNTDAIVGLSVGLGIFAVIAVAVAAVLYTRLKKANEGYSKALIELHRKNGPTGSSDRQMDDMTIPLGENL